MSSTTRSTIFSPMTSHNGRSLLIRSPISIGSA